VLPLDEPSAVVPLSSPGVLDELDELQPVPTANARPRPSEAMNKSFEFCIGKVPLS
jgi:hypothetical protein